MFVISYEGKQFVFFLYFFYLELLYIIVHISVYINKLIV